MATPIPGVNYSILGYPYYPVPAISPSTPVAPPVQPSPPVVEQPVTSPVVTNPPTTQQPSSGGSYTGSGSGGSIIGSGGQTSGAGVYNPPVSNVPVLNTPILTGVLPDQFEEYLTNVLGQGDSDGGPVYYASGDSGDSESSSETDDASRFEEIKQWLLAATIIESVPNWVLLAGGGVIIYTMARGSR